MALSSLVPHCCIQIDTDATHYCHCVPVYVRFRRFLAFSRNAITRDCFELLHAFTRTLLRLSGYSGDAGIDAFDWQNAATFSTCDLDASTPTSSQSSEVMPCSFAALRSGSAARSISMCQVNATHSYWLGLDDLHTRSARHSHDVKVKVKVNGV